MKRWELNVVVEAESIFGPEEILGRIGQEVNREDGIYLHLEKATIKPLKKSTKVLKPGQWRPCEWCVSYDVEKDFCNLFIVAVKDIKVCHNWKIMKKEQKNVLSKTKKRDL